jgi:endonuclease/exonuclease/phosphatase family metal-dependent hydrolase
MKRRNPRMLLLAQILPFACVGISGHAFASTLRIVTYNIEDDINGATTPLPGMNTVLEGLGNAVAGGIAQPLDIMALEETTSNTTTVAPIVSMLNGDYTGSNYQMSSYQATSSGGDVADGNGPNAIVYNANTVTLLASAGIGTPTGSSNGEYRQVVRYEFEAVGTTTPFYVYVAHTKSGTTAADATARGKEATIIRNNEATLPANASVLYMGDLNSAPPEAEFTNFTAAGQGQAFDPANFSTSKSFYSDNSTSLKFRDDYELMTSNILNGTGAINYVSGTLQSLGNNGSTTSVKSASNTDLSYMTAAAGYNPTGTQVLSALTTASDHLPVFADYTFALPLLLGDANGDGVVDLNDLNIVLNNLGTTTSLRSNGNFDGAATIDLTDLNDVLNNLGAGTTSGSSLSLTQIAAAPEPASLGILALAGIALIPRRRPR